MEEPMKSGIIAGALLLLATTAFAKIGGGDIMLKNSGGDTVFSHEIHVTAGQNCTSCHDNLYTNVKQHKKVSMKEMQKGKSCGFCHNGKTAFSVKNNCAKCHKK